MDRLSAVSRWHYKHLGNRLQSLRQQHVLMEYDLASRLGYFFHVKPTLSSIRELTIPDNLPTDLRPLLGKWLRADGRLSRVDRVRCKR